MGCTSPTKKQSSNQNTNLIKTDTLDKYQLAKDTLHSSGILTEKELDLTLSDIIIKF